MELAEVRRKDIEPISNLFLSVFSEPPWNEYWEYQWVYERLQWIYESKGFYGYFVELEGTIIGAILGCVVPFCGQKGFEIKELFVDSKFQGKGIGTKLIERLESELNQSNHKFIILLTARESNAESFYLNKGYQANNKLVLLRKNF